MKRLILLGCLLMLASGCTSFRSTILQRNPDDTFSSNIPVGKTRGVPVKLKVPSHLEVVVTEEFFIQAKIEQDKSEFREIPIVFNNSKIRALMLTTEVQYTDKVFTVDFNRPAGGLLNLSSVTFDQEQYFASIAAEYEERTLADISTAISTLKPVLAQASSVKLPNDSKLVTSSREVARARFDVSQPGWENELHAFIEHHITACYGDCHYVQ